MRLRTSRIESPLRVNVLSALGTAAVAGLGVLATACAPRDRPVGELDDGPAESVQGGAALLFAGGSGRLSEEEQSEIFAQLGLRISDDAKVLVDETCGQPVTYAVEFRDLNADGTDEVIVDAGNGCMSGAAGTSVTVFRRAPSGGYEPVLGLPGMIAEVREAANIAYPDLLVGGPGFCFGLWRWDGEQYAHFRNEAQEPGGCDGR